MKCDQQKAGGARKSVETDVKSTRVEMGLQSGLSRASRRWMALRMVAGSTMLTRMMMEQ